MITALVLYLVFGAGFATSHFIWMMVDESILPFQSWKDIALSALALITVFVIWPLVAYWLITDSEIGPVWAGKDEDL